MPNKPRLHQADVTAGPDEALDALLAGELPAGGAGAGLRPVAELLATLTAPPEQAELAGHARALAEFRQTRLAERHRQAAAPGGARRRAAARQQRTAAARRRRAARPRSLRTLLSTRAAAMVGALAAAFGAVATAAYAGALPASVQQIAHEIIGAPPPHPASHAGRQSPQSSPAGSPQAVGLCTAYAQARAHGTAAQRAVAFRRLATAAGGAGKIAAYCAVVPTPGASPPAAQGSGKPSSKPSGPRGKPTAPPTPRSGKPSTPAAGPAPHNTGKPTSLPGRPSASPTAHAATVVS